MLKSGIQWSVLISSVR